MTNKQKGLIDAVAELFPNAAHRFCVRHLYNNFKGDFKGLVLKEILWKAARASTVPAFQKAMAEMKKADPKAYDWLNARPAINWTRSHFDPFPKCDIMLNNLSKSFNAAILPARDKPIITMLERIRSILMESTKRRRETMIRCKDPICPKIRKRLDKIREVNGWIPRYFGNEQFQVEGSNDQFRVDLKNRTCGCRKWDLCGIPCVHASAAYNKLDLDPMDFVHECYKVSTYLSTYDNVLGPINGRDLWPCTGDKILLPPDVKKRAGRPKKARRREPGEEEERGCKVGPPIGPSNAAQPDHAVEIVDHGGPPNASETVVYGGPLNGAQNLMNVPISSEVTSVVTGLYGGSQDSQGLFNSQVSSVGTNMAGGSQPKVRHCFESEVPVTNQMHAMPW
ncbi:hypothetical protein Vadar_019174 [Vaccinium darrowii]|uniref:Uncharacterized protein n=1 Tax=Vaccinium darrowii TaxID=229202 RepID=A0ACB7YEQ1_9ERIC|nr:hypothetical protein Vadar_019174 [Vaccinium darrowii]